ncbi:Protein of unknown function (DUF3435) domain containing protein [Lactarius tabidus]
MLITFTHHKSSENRPKPTIFYFTPTKRLIFCLITLIVSIAVLDGIFESPTLTSVEPVFTAGISGPVSYLPLRWKKEWLKRPVFQHCDSDLNSPLPYHTLHDYMGRQSLDMGYERPIHPKDWQRNMGNTVNSPASDTVCDQIMCHNNHSNVFQDAYLSAHMKLDMQSAVLGEPPKTAVLNMLSHVGHSRDPHASSDMVPDDVWALLPPDPAIEALEQERARLKGGQFRIKGSQHEGAVKRLTTLISTRRATWKKTVPKQYRLYYFQNHMTTWDLERQAYGEVPVKDKKHPRDLHLPERATLARLLCDQPNDLNPEELHQRCIEVGSSMVRLGRLRERIRPEIQGFLALLPPLRAFPVSMTAQLTELRPHPLRGPQRTRPATPIPALWRLVLLLLLSATAPPSRTALSPASTTTSLKVLQHTALPASLVHLP